MKNSTLAILLLGLGLICSTNASCSYPTWPQDFKWSYAGPITGMNCERIFEPNDPHTWADNYFCHKSAHGMQGIGMRWSNRGMSVLYSNLNLSCEPRPTHTSVFLEIL